jgi:GNAT superfamily N-acetyltransferase
VADLAAAIRPPLAPELLPGIVARDPVPDDQGYVTSTWMRSMRTIEPYRDWSRRRFNTRVADLLDQLLEHADVRVLIAGQADAPDRIVGWICFAPIAGAPVIHYTYVREGRDERDRWRRQGVARALLTSVLRSDPHGPTRAPLYTGRGPGLRHLLKLYPHAAYLPLEEFLR